MLSWCLLFKIKKFRDELLEINGRDLPAVLVGNKTDVIGKNRVSSEEGLLLSQELNNISFFEISCKEDNVKRIGFFYQNHK